MGLKKLLINFGLDLIVDKAFKLASENKAAITIFLEDKAIRWFNSMDSTKLRYRLKESGFEDEDIQLIKDRFVFLTRGFITVLLNVLLVNVMRVKSTILKELKIN